MPPEAVAPRRARDRPGRLTLRLRVPVAPGCGPVEVRPVPHDAIHLPSESCPGCDAGLDALLVLLHAVMPARSWDRLAEGLALSIEQRGAFMKMSAEALRRAQAAAREFPDPEPGPPPRGRAIDIE